MDSVNKYIEQHKERFLNELFDLIRIPSVSALKENKENMYRAANYIKDMLMTSGASEVKVMDTKGWPAVYAEKIVNPDWKTVLVYGHYDVQPPEPLDEWESPPFEPEIRNDRIFARGADDDKGQLFMHIKAFEYMVAENKLPCNVKFLIEGEEEISSPSLKQFCLEHKEILSADVILASDTNIMSLATPVLAVGLRGIAYFELTVKGPVADLHSGLYGGSVANPANVLAELIAGMKDENGHITIPGFYDDVQNLSGDERKLLNGIPFNENDFAAGISVQQLFGEKDYSTIERLGIRPTLDVNGMWSGYTGQGAKTILPAKATAKISMRLVPDQTPEKIEALFQSYLEKAVPPTVTYHLEVLHGGNPYLIPWNSKEMKAAIQAMEKTLTSPLPVHSGGSIPVISDFEEILGIKAVLMGFGMESDAIHSPNENYPLKNFFKGIETIPWFYHFYSKE